MLKMRTKRTLRSSVEPLEEDTPADDAPRIKWGANAGKIFSRLLIKRKIVRVQVAHVWQPVRVLVVKVRGPSDMETTCVPDVATLRWTGCPTSPWRERAAAALNPSAPILLNIGANKGFAASEFLSLFSQRAVGAKRWHRAVVGYGRAHKLGFVDATSCGACGACGARAPERHSRDGGRVHLLELLPSTRTLLRHVIDTLHVHDVVSMCTILLHPTSPPS
jgi:hypothetical protein